jgi:glycogen debranching enzyme
MRSVLTPIFRTPALIRSTPYQALKTVTSKSGMGVYASSDTLFKGAVFGRDSLEVAEDLIAVRGRLVERIILTLAALQGETFNKDNEEELGKIIHEYRTSKVDGKHADAVTADILKKLSARWGGTSNMLAYYGSVDSTPLFVRVVWWYTMLYGRAIMSKKVQLRSGSVILMTDVMERAVDWMLKKISESKSGMIEFKRLNPKGIENQVWKDSKEFYIHADGQKANHNKPISSIEVQAVTYDALKGAAKLLPQRGGELNRVAEELRNKTIELLWLEEIEYFALGTDYDEENNLRIIKTITANPGEMLDSTFFNDLPEIDSRRYISALVREIMGYEFLTDAGIRSRGLSESKLVPFWDYHGSYTSWPKETYDVAKGLKRQGFLKLAHELENRLLNVVRAMKAFPEFIYVDHRGRVLGMPNTRSSHGELIFVDSHNKPEKTQAWTVSAIIAINSSLRKRFIKRPGAASWQRKLEKEVLSHIPHVNILKSQKELLARYPSYPYSLSNNKIIQ